MATTAEMKFTHKVKEASLFCGSFSHPEFRPRGKSTPSAFWPHPQLHPKVYRVHSEAPLGKTGAFKEDTHLLVHFNVQPIRHFIVLKNKRGTGFFTNNVRNVWQKLSMPKIQHRNDNTGFIRTLNRTFIQVTLAKPEKDCHHKLSPCCLQEVHSSGSSGKPPLGSSNTTK